MLAAALVYPRTGRFASELRYRFFDGLPLICLPFDVAEPGDSVRRFLQALGELTGTAQGYVPAATGSFRP